MNIKDKATNEVIGTVITNHSMSFDEVMEIAGFEYVEGDNESGWTKDGKVFYDEDTAEVE